MYRLSDGNMAVRPTKNSVPTLATSVSVLIAILCISFRSIAIGQDSTLPNGVACGNVSQSSAVLWAHSIAVGEGTFEYEEGAVVQLSADPDDEYNFYKWEGDKDTIEDDHAADTTITMNDDYDITAKFKED